MKRKIYFILFFFLLSEFIVFAQIVPNLYSKAYGDIKNPAVIFLHGGPGYNSVGFELSTAQKLADHGFYVIVFDQRGCARSDEPADSKYTMDEACADLMSIFIKYNVHSALLIGHSWGGALGTFFAEKNPKMVKAIVLIGAPISMQMSLKAILKNCRKFYIKKEDDDGLERIKKIEKMDTASFAYSSNAFYNAGQCHLYKPKTPSEASDSIYGNMSLNKDYDLLYAMNSAPAVWLSIHEHYTTYNLGGRVKKLLDAGIKIYGIYGSEDDLFDDKQLKLIGSEIGKKNLFIVDQASHNVFIDQQEKFIEIFTKCR